MVKCKLFFSDKIIFSWFAFTVFFLLVLYSFISYFCQLFQDARASGRPGSYAPDSLQLRGRI